MRDIQIGSPDHALEFVGGALALDFTNTLGGTHRAPTHDHIRSYEELVAFAFQSGALSKELARDALAEAKRRPAKAMEVLQRAIALREAAWRTFSAISNAKAPTSSDLANLNREAAIASANAFVVRRGSGFEWTWQEGAVLERPLWPVSRSAIELLTSDPERARIRECASETCEWLFIDRSKSHTRRWCDMNDCGNRAKQRRFRQRRDPSQVALPE